MSLPRFMGSRGEAPGRFFRRFPPCESSSPGADIPVATRLGHNRTRHLRPRARHALGARCPTRERGPEERPVYVTCPQGGSGGPRTEPRRLHRRLPARRAPPLRAHRERWASPVGDGTKAAAGESAPPHAPAGDGARGTGPALESHYTTSDQDHNICKS